MNLKIIAPIAVLSVLVGCGARHVLHENARLKGQVKDAKAAAAQVEKDRVKERSLWQLGEVSQQRHEAIQTKIVTEVKTIQQKVPVYVHDQIPVPGCVSYGLVRVLDAAALGKQPEDLPLPAGVTDDTCSPLRPSDLARGVAENLGIGRQNAAQLDALQADVKARFEEINRP